MFKQARPAQALATLAIASLAACANMTSDPARHLLTGKCYPLASPTQSPVAGGGRRVIWTQQPIPIRRQSTAAWARCCPC